MTLRDRGFALLRALCEDHYTPPRVADHAWQKCPHCVAEHEVSTSSTARAALRLLLIEVDTNVPLAAPKEIR